MSCKLCIQIPNDFLTLYSNNNKTDKWQLVQKIENRKKIEQRNNGFKEVRHQQSLGLSGKNI